MTLDVEKIREDFPILGKTVNGKKLVYLDSAATSQKPAAVIDAVTDFYRNRNANVARGLYSMAEEATREYEEVRDKVQAFINAGSREEIVFTKNATEGANIVMRGWGEKFIRKGDRIVTTVMEHHSNFVPWQQLALRTGAEFEMVDITKECELDWNDLEKKMKGAKLVAVSAASNVIGTLNDTKKICSLAHEYGAICVIDGAQSVPSMKTDVKSMDCDFLMFSGHKMLAPFGSGALYGKQELLESMDPFLYGSEMIRSVRKEKSEWNDLPFRFESGTPDVSAVIGFGVAMDYLEKVGLDNIREHEMGLTEHLLARLPEVEGLEILGPKDAGKRAGLVAFVMDGIHPHDIAAMLDSDAICVRSGHHCAMPLHERLGVSASTRASVYLYNKKDEIDALIESLKNVRNVFR
ncbi:cysteine desulfurase [Candidatus Micrarchaeota archaeon]|nr:cysteine desulfurase [Candidatus Micrarchaeota archaeon]